MDPKIREYAEMVLRQNNPKDPIYPLTMKEAVEIARRIIERENKRPSCRFCAPGWPCPDHL